jgi:hypothetical protein
VRDFPFVKADWPSKKGVKKNVGRAFWTGKCWQTSGKKPRGLANARAADKVVAADVSPHQFHFDDLLHGRF